MQLEEPQDWGLNESWDYLSNMKIMEKLYPADLLIFTHLALLQ